MATEVILHTQQIKSGQYTLGTYTISYTHERSGAYMLYTVKVFVDMTAAHPDLGTKTFSATINGEEKSGSVEIPIGIGTAEDSVDYSIRIKGPGTLPAALTSDWFADLEWDAAVESGGAPKVMARISGAWETGDGIRIGGTDADRVKVRVGGTWEESE